MEFSEFKEAYQKKEVIEVFNEVPETPLVSICVQTYQHENFIKKCIEGILMQQTDFQIEILIGEDHSTDNTRKICLDYATRFPDLIRLFLHHRENQINVLGEPTANFNALYNFYKTRGKYIAFCEGDDFWTDPLQLQKQVNFLENHKEYVLTFHEFQIMDQNEKVLPPTEIFYYPRNPICAANLTKNIYHPLLLSICFRKCFHKIPPEMAEVINVDTFLLSLLGKYGDAMFLKDVQPSRYRKHLGGVWSKQSMKKKYFYKIVTYDRLASYYFRINITETAQWYSKKADVHLKMLTLYCIKTGDFITAAKTAWRRWKSRTGI